MKEVEYTKGWILELRNVDLILYYNKKTKVWTNKVVRHPQD